MMRFLRWGVLPVFAAAVVLLVFLLLACGVVQLEMYVAASMTCSFCERYLPYAFIAFLFVFATGIAPCLALKRLGVRHLLAYLPAGAVSGALAEYCYLYDMEVWYNWDFSVPAYETILTDALQHVPMLTANMIGMQPYTAIPLGVGLAGSGLYWLLGVKRPFRRTQ